MDTFGTVAYILEHCEIDFSGFLFLRLIIDLIVLIIKHTEINKMTGPSLRFGKTLLSASYSNFLTSVMISIKNPQANGSASDSPKKVERRVKIQFYEMRKDAKKQKSSFTFTW